jgi:uncharacterized protein (TIGR02001 family)
VRRGRGHGLACALGLLVLWLAAPAQAQLAGSATLASEHRLRGFSLADGPVLVLSAAYDHPSGFYAGGSVIAYDSDEGPARILGHTEYVGYAVQRDGGPSFDVGFANVDMTIYAARRRSLEYQQVYVGVAKDAVAARLSYSPDYPRPGVDSAYLDLNAAVRPAENWRLTGHLGTTFRLGGSRAIDGKAERYDLRVALARTFARAEVQVAWTGLTPRPKPRNARSRSGFSVAASWFF